MSEHSNVCGGSNAERRYHCPLSRSLEAEAPKRTSAWAEAGSRNHTGMEMVLINFPENMKEAQPHINELVGHTFDFETDPIDDEIIATKIGPAFTEWFRIVKEYGFDDWFIETRVDMSEVIKGAFGKCDILAIDKKKRLHILDWKFGDGVPVPAEDNMGLMFYAGAALNDSDPEMQEFLEDVYDDTPVFLHIVQPTDRVDREHYHQVWETTVDHIEDFVDQLAVSIERSYDDDPQPKPGDWCRWCAGSSGSCPAARQLVASSAKKKIEGMDAAELGEFLTQLTMVAALKEKAFSFAQKELEAGKVIPGWKLVQKRGTRQWKDPDAVLAYCKKSSMKQEVYLDQTLKSPAQMEKRATERTWKQKLAPMVHSHSSGVTIAPDSDKRPAVVGSLELLANALDGASPAKAVHETGDSKK